MKIDTRLKVGDMAITLGYYQINDGGSATYKIRTVTNDDIIDNITIIPLNDDTNNLIGELIVPNKLNLKIYTYHTQLLQDNQKLS